MLSRLVVYLSVCLLNVCLLLYLSNCLFLHLSIALDLFVLVCYYILIKKVDGVDKNEEKLAVLRGRAGDPVRVDLVPDPTLG